MRAVLFMQGQSNLVKKFLLLLSGLIALYWLGHRVLFSMPTSARRVIFNNLINLFGHQLGWQTGRIFLRKVYQKTTTEWPLYGILYFILPFWAWVIAKHPNLQALGLGRSVAGFASIGVWILMERLFEVRAKPRHWPRYFSFYIVFYHLSGLLTQATFGTSLFAYRHAWASMVAFLLLTTVLPSFLLWSEGAEINRGSFFQRFFYHVPRFKFTWLRRLSNFSQKNARAYSSVFSDSYSRGKLWSLWGKRVVNWKHFNGVVIGLAGVILACLSAAYPIYFRFQIQGHSSPLPMPFSMALLCLIFGNILGFFVRKLFLRFSALWRLKIDLIGIAFTASAFLKIRHAPAFCLNLIALGMVCHMLYPDLLTRMQQWSAMKPLNDVRQKMENCLQYSNYVFVIVSLIDRLVLPLIFSECKRSKNSIDDFLYYFLNGYLFLFCFALIPDEADHLVTQGKLKMKGWIKTKQKTVAKKVLEEIKTIKISEKKLPPAPSIWIKYFQKFIKHPPKN